MASGGAACRGPHFDQMVSRNGYAWWYIDAVSDDKAHGLTLIAFIGSVFSPYYLRARRKSEGDPTHHVALNVALYGKKGHRWTMTERGRESLHQTVRSLAIGPSSLEWDGQDLIIKIDEITVPFPSRLKGTVRLTPSALMSSVFTLDSKGEHLWCPIAPISRVEVRFEDGLSWQGNGYFDWNGGLSPLESSFKSWHWSRASDQSGAVIFYDVSRRDGEEDGLALHVDPTGKVKSITPPPSANLPSTGLWRIRRLTRSEVSAKCRIVKTLEDTPFYARSLITSHVDGKELLAMHESLYLDRFVSPLVQWMLPFRMPRRTGSFFIKS
ncbi:MAG: carotenoid 1,2-hydratase [Hyphomicrobium sp.]